MKSSKKSDVASCILHFCQISCLPETHFSLSIHITLQLTYQMFSSIYLLKMTSPDSQARCDHCSSSTSSTPQLPILHHNQSPLYSNMLLLNALYPQLTPQSQSIESQLALKSCCNPSQSNLFSELLKVTPHVSGTCGEAQCTATADSRPPLTSAAKRRHRRKRNQLKRYAYLASTVAATTASMLDATRPPTNLPSSTFSKRKTSAPLIYNHNSFNCNHSNSDHFYNYYNATSNKSYSRYVSCNCSFATLYSVLYSNNLFFKLVLLCLSLITFFMTY